MTICDTIISKKKEEIFNQIESIMNMWGTGDIKMHNHNL